MPKTNPRIEARRNAGFRTQSDIAEWLNMARSTIANWESGFRTAPEWYDKVIDLLIENREMRQELTRIHQAMRLAQEKMDQATTV